MVQEYNYKGVYTYLYTDQDSYEPLAHVFYNGKDGKLYLSYYHTDQIGLPREQTDQFGNLLWVGEYDAWGSLKTENRVYPNAHQPFRLQNQYCDEETGLHYNLFRYYDPNSGRFVNQDPIGLAGGEHLYWFAPNATGWVDPLGLNTINPRIMATAARGQWEEAVGLMRNAANLSEKEVATLVRRCATKRGNELVKFYKNQGVGTGATSGQHGTPYMRASSDLVREANQISDKGIQEIIKKVAEQLRQQGKGINHR